MENVHCVLYTCNFFTTFYYNDGELVNFKELMTQWYLYLLKVISETAVLAIYIAIFIENKFLTFKIQGRKIYKQ